MSYSVAKRDGKIVEFNQDKILTAISKANIKTNEITEHNLTSLTKEVIDKLNTIHKDDDSSTVVTVEEIQDLVEEALINHNYKKTAKEYILYRNKRSQTREARSYIANTIRDFTFKDSADNAGARDNANINSDTSAGTMLYYGSSTSKWFSLNNLINPKHAELHKSGYIHIHDLDYYSIGTCNCLQIPLDKLLKSGFTTGNGFIRPPSNIRTAAALSCIVIQSNQNDMYQL